jgi:hypothetical protein
MRTFFQILEYVTLGLAAWCALGLLFKLVQWLTERISSWDLFSCTVILILISVCSWRLRDGC